MAVNGTQRGRTTNSIGKLPNFHTVVIIRVILSFDFTVAGLVPSSLFVMRYFNFLSNSGSRHKFTLVVFSCYGVNPQLNGVLASEGQENNSETNYEE